MDVHPEVRRVEIRQILPASSAKFANVHFAIHLEYSVTSNGGKTLDISFEVPADQGLDAAVTDAKALLQEFGEALAEAAKNV